MTCDQCGQKIRGSAVRVSPIESVHPRCKAAWEADMADEYVPTP
jgi:hypothetical protein